MPPFSFRGCIEPSLIPLKMSKHMNEVWNSCANLVSEKLTERKKGAEKLELLLRDADVVQVIDERSSRKSKSREQSITWDYLVDQLRRYTDIEIR